jgi:hypothetical protein
LNQSPTDIYQSITWIKNEPEENTRPIFQITGWPHLGYEYGAPVGNPVLFFFTVPQARANFQTVAPYAPGRRAFCALSALEEILERLVP